MFLSEGRAAELGQWFWYNARGQAIRSETDTNGDGLPDIYWERGKAEGSPTRLAVEQSWIVNSELIPEQYRVPDQESRRLPIRRIPE
jgi:hypothetical protein